MGLPELFHLLNFFVRPTVKETAVLALVAGIEDLGPNNLLGCTFIWVADLFYFTNFFRCLFKKRRNDRFENSQL